VNRKADLHIHTMYSDGSLSPSDVVRIASQRGICCISITDHDNVFGVDEAMSAGNAYHVEIIPGVEISAEESGREMHILGYCMDYHDKDLISFLKKIRQDRVERLRKMAGLLSERGMRIDVDDLLSSAGEVSISRLHIAMYMHKKGLVRDWRDAFRTYIGDNRSCYVANFSYTSKEVIDAIKAAGGIPVLAHPGINRLDTILPRLVKEGIRGIEAFHSEHSGKAARGYESFASCNGLIVTGGSDCHGGLKGEVIIGKSAIPYSYVGALKNAKSDR